MKAITLLLLISLAFDINFMEKRFGGERKFPKMKKLD